MSRFLGMLPVTFAAAAGSLMPLLLGCQYDMEAEFARANQPTGRTYVHGYVRLPDGTPAEGVHVLGLTTNDSLTLEILEEGFRGTIQTHTSAHTGRLHRVDKEGVWTPETGEFRLDMKDVRAVVVYGEAGYAEVPIDDATDPLNVTLRPWASVEGTLRIGSKPGGEELVMAVHMAGPAGMYQWRTYVSAQTIADEQGKFAVKRVPAGDIHVGRSINHNPAGGAWLDAQPGGRHEVSLGGDGRPIRGRLVLDGSLAEKVNVVEIQALLSQKPRPGQRVDHYGLHNETFSVWLDPDDAGAFRADDVPEGDYVLNAWYHPPPDADAAGPGESRSVRFAILRLAVPASTPATLDIPVELGELRLKPER